VTLMQGKTAQMEFFGEIQTIGSNKTKFFAVEQ